MVFQFKLYIWYFKILNMYDKNEARRSYRMDDAHLIVLSKTTIAFLKRDIVELAQFGISNSSLTIFENEVNAFENFHADIVLMGAQMILTEDKKVLADEIREAISCVLVRAKKKYGIHTARYKSFGATKLTSMSELNLLMAGYRVVRAGHKRLADLSAQGLTVAELDALNTLCDRFKILILEQGESVSERAIMQEDRVLAGNAVYEQLRSYCSMAKTAWRTKNAAKYNDYLIYDSSSSTTEKNTTTIDEDDKSS